MADPLTDEQVRKAVRQIEEEIRYARELGRRVTTGVLYISTLETLLAALRDVREWRDSILGLCKTFPDFESLPWGGDKEGWGFVFEMLKYIERLRTESVAALRDVREERDAARLSLGRCRYLIGEYDKSEEKLRLERDEIARRMEKIQDAAVRYLG